MDTPTLFPASALRFVDAPAAAKPLALRIGFEMHFEFAVPTPLVLMLNVHPDVVGQLESPERFDIAALTNDGPLKPKVETFLDGFGNRCQRLLAPAGVLRVAHENIFHDVYEKEPQPAANARQHPADELPTDALPFLLGSRYCEIDRLGAIAWDLFGHLNGGGERATAINRWVFENITFGYRLTRPNKTALDTFVERTGVCRDMMHLAISFCRAMNIPARYATGYLGDIDADPDPTPMDYSAFYEVYLDGKWWPMDARHGKPRVGRVLMGRGRDAADVALITSFGRHRLAKFVVITDELDEQLNPIVPPTPLKMSA